MNVEPLEGNPLQFLVESRALQCERCLTRFLTRELRQRGLSLGAPCPVCSGVLKRAAPYLVDLSSTWPIGECACKDGQIKVARWNKLSADEKKMLSARELGMYRCEHNERARQYIIERIFRAIVLEESQGMDQGQEV